MHPKSGLDQQRLIKVAFEGGLCVELEDRSSTYLAFQPDRLHDSGPTKSTPRGDHSVRPRYEPSA